MITIDLPPSCLLHMQQADILSELSVRFLPMDMVTHWQRCGMTADFLAQYIAHHFDDHAHASNIIATVLNELLENSIKFSIDKSQHVDVLMRHTGDTLSIEACNMTDMQHAEQLKAVMKDISEQDTNTLFIQQLEHAAECCRNSSGIGLITLIKDYAAHIGIRIEPHATDGLYHVAVSVLLNANEVEKT